MAGVEDCLDLLRSGKDITRWECYSAPFRIELSPALRERLAGRWVRATRPETAMFARCLAQPRAAGVRRAAGQISPEDPEPDLWRVKKTGVRLLSLLVGTDIESIEAVYRARYRGFRDALATVTHSNDSARDAVQEGFAIALARRDTFRGGSLEAWIWTISMRCALGTRPTDLSRPALDRLDPRTVEPDHHPELAAAIRTLPARTRLIVFLRYYADLSYAEIATACDVREGTVGAALAHARDALARQLDTEGLRR